jgi:hypothetical protein
LSVTFPNKQTPPPQQGMASRQGPSRTNPASGVRRNLFHHSLNRRPVASTSASASTTATVHVAAEQDSSSDIVARDEHGNYQLDQPSLAPLPRDELQEDRGAQCKQLHLKEHALTRRCRRGQPIDRDIWKATPAAYRAQRYVICTCFFVLYIAYSLFANLQKSSRRRSKPASSPRSNPSMKTNGCLNQTTKNPRKHPRKSLSNHGYISLLLST